MPVAESTRRNRVYTPPTYLICRNNNATRGQTSKIVANTFFPDCDTPSAFRR